LQVEIEVYHALCGAIRSLKSTYAGSFRFDLHRKFLFWDFAARKRNIFSRPAIKNDTYWTSRENRLGPMLRTDRAIQYKLS
jgi:hypothetical protein